MLSNSYSVFLQFYAIINSLLFFVSRSELFIMWIHTATWEDTNPNIEKGKKVLDK